jgi:hypothetical protein
VLQETEFTHLRWVKQSGPLTCIFLQADLHCSAAARNPGDAVDQHIPVSEPYGLLWPISPFSIGSLARESERDLKQLHQASLVSIRQPRPDNPVDVLILTGDLEYLGVEDFKTAGQHWQAYKFSLQVPFHPQLLLWTSSQGLLLGISVENSRPDWPKEGVRLIRFTKWNDF